MHFEIITDETTRIAVASGSKAEIADTQSALELAMRAKYEAAAEKLLIDKRILSDAFFHPQHGTGGGNPAKVYQLSHQSRHFRRLHPLYQQTPAGFYL